MDRPRLHMRVRTGVLFDGLVEGHRVVLRFTCAEDPTLNEQRVSETHWPTKGEAEEQATVAGQAVRSALLDAGVDVEVGAL